VDGEGWQRRRHFGAAAKMARPGGLAPTGP
jgi:hypothetical protein